MAPKKLHDVIIPSHKVARSTDAARKTRDETIKAIAGKPSRSVFSPLPNVSGAERDTYKHHENQVIGMHPRGSERKRRDAGSKPFLWIAVAVFVFLAVLLSTLFEEASIIVTPRSKTESLDKVFVAAKTPGASEVPLRIITATDTVAKTIPATHITDVERRAQGKVIIYNDYSTAPQRLVKNTRFETPQGLTYHLRESVTVPGQKVVKGTRLPGSVEIVVFAAEAGDKYNIGLTDFTVPGFKGTPRYSKFYGRSKTEMAGGFKGKVKTVPEEEMKAVQEELRAAVGKQLREKTAAQTPEGFVLFADAQFIEYPEEGGEPLQPSLEKNTIEVSQTATLYAALLGRDILTKMIASPVDLDAGKSDSIRVANLDALAFKLLSKEKIDSDNEEKFQFSLKGDPKIVWQFDEVLLKASFAGKPRSESDEIVSLFPGIIKAEVALRPFWKRTFPKDPQDILVKIAEEP